MRFIGMVGADAAADGYEQELRRLGVEPQLLRCPAAEPTATCLCLVNPPYETCCFQWRPCCTLFEALRRRICRLAAAVCAALDSCHPHFECRMSRLCSGTPCR